MNNRTQIHFLISAVAEVNVVFINVIASFKILLNFVCIDGCRKLNRIWIPGFPNFLDSQI